MKYPILIPNIFNHPFTYISDFELQIGDYVVVPFGKSKLIGVVWNEFEKGGLKNFKINQWNPKAVIIELHDNNPIYECLREDCDNIVDYFKYHKYKPIYKDKSNTIYTK